MQLDVRDLRLIDAVAEEGSLTRAGYRLHVTQPALSRHLHDLEVRLRLTLFDRRGRAMALTPAGEVLRRHAKDILAAVGRAEAEARALSGEKPQRLRISTECYTSYHWLPLVLNRFSAAHPGCDVRIIAEVTRRAVPALLDGEIDLALINTPTRDRRLRVRPVFEDEFVAVVAPGHPWAGRATVEPADFADQRLLLIVAPEHSTVYQSFLRPAGVRPRQISEVMLTEAAIAMAEAGYGVSCLTRWAVAPQVRAGTLVPVRLGRQGLYREWMVVTRRADGRPRHLEDFTTLLARFTPADAVLPGSRT